MNIVDVPLEISVISNGVLPKTTLPQRDLSISAAYDHRPRFHDGVRKSAFDEAQSIRVIRVAIRQRHDNVQVVRQDHNRIDRERMRAARVSHSRAQGNDVIDQRLRSSVRDRHGKEKRSTRDDIPTIPDHASIVTRISP
jgi:hypothetical protein